MAKSDAPKDKFFLVGIIFFILGLGTLLPWNFFITAIPYFKTRLIVANRTECLNCTTTKDEFNFNNWMTLLSQIPLLLFTFLNSFLYHWVPERVRITGSMLAILLLFILTAVLVKVELTPESAFSFTMATVWFINSFCAVLQGSLFGLLGLLPQRYNSLFMSGQGMAGTFAALAMVMAIASGTDTETLALGYFIIPCVGTCISIICYLVLPHLDFAHYYLHKNQADGCEMETKVELLKPESNGTTESSKKAFLNLVVAENGTTKAPKKSSVFLVFRKIWVVALCVTCTFTVTLSIFPAVAADVASATLNPTWNKYFTSVSCFLAFNIMDWIGRSATSFITWPDKNSKLLPVLVGVRVVFIPLFMLCNVQNRSHLPVFFLNDAWFLVFMLPFSLSNGYLVSLNMCYGPMKVLPHEAEMAGALMTFFLALGLTLGGAVSFLVKILI
ncbi:equilibrative nucleoside transporter 2 [Latimeria chalumnae]|uniref:equilibrative nucleoside transporter 2 n=1 Tax=Latimeria chalumnae TaxID=7897 RepID=UPI00313AF1EC